MWKLIRLEEGEWRETGETFTGTSEELATLLLRRETEDGWDYDKEPIEE